MDGKSPASLMIARVYLRVSTDVQDLERQETIIASAKAAGYYIAGIYKEKASGARADRPELLRMVKDLQPGEVVIAEKIDRISRLPLAEAERLVASIGVLSRNRRKFRQPINVACPAPGRWGRPNSRVTSRHFDHGNASRTSRPDCSGLDEAD